ncbi:hypothetical protein KKG31_06345 [Patescibacteria group bacterium]|nr:hypothetical protein [Patescibacteria group bacterium]MBU1758716.1 hypothetical protein [Patescibacteria group bacterium]
MRRLIRRMYFNLNLLYKLDDKRISSFLDKMIEEIANIFVIKDDAENIYGTIYKECLQYQKTIDK